ncbi:MAG: DUF5666 domain-containing protein [Acidimicrobiales bacterium]
MKRFHTKLVTRLALVTLLGAGVTLSSLSVASAAAPPRTSAARSATIQFSGDVIAYTAATSSTAGSITLTDRAGATLTFSTSSSTTVTEIGGSGSTLEVNDFATVQATIAAPSAATTITFSAAAPVSFSGVVTAYTAPSGSTNGSVTLLKRNLASLTYAVTSTTAISQNGGGDATIAVDDFATIQAAAATPNVALTISFDVAAPVRFTGRVTAYSAAMSSANGSLTIKDSAGASLTYTTLLTTTITEKSGSGDSLAVGDHATVVAAASAKTDALTITFTPAPPVSFYGQVTAYTAASGATNGSITLVKANGNSATFSVTSSTVIREKSGSGDTLVVGDYATVEATRALPTTARAINYRPFPRPVTFHGRVTAYTPASGSTNGSLTVRRRDGAVLTYSLTSSTTITETGGTGETLAVRDWVTVRASGTDKTVATSIVFRATAEIGFFGHVTAYTPVSGSTAGSITLTNRAGASLTFVVSSTTTLTQLQGSGSALSVGDYAVVHAAASAKSDALTIGFTVSPPIVFAGRISTYTAASGSTAGSLTIQKRNGASLTYSVTSTTTIAEINGLGAAPAPGDQVTVVALPSAPSVAVTITFTVHR